MAPIKQHKSQTSSDGFALLLSIITIGVVLSVTLTTMSLAIKQGQLSADSRDSELAFHAASAGLECIRHWRREESDRFEDGDDVPIECFGVSGVNAEQANSYTQSSSAADVDGPGTVHFYEYQVSWGAGSADRCSEMKFLVFNTDLSQGDSLTLRNIPENFIAGYPGEDGEKECEAGGLCTVFSSRGYSEPCADSFPIGTIQRDIFVEF